MIAAPYFSIDTPTPAWGRTTSGDNNRIVHEIDARGSGLYGGITPQRLIPHGETVSVHASAMIQSDATSTANGYEGITHSLQGFVRGPTGAAVKVYDNNVLTNGDPDQWINKTFADYTRVTFIDQLPDNVSPEWLESVWLTKCITGQTRFANLEIRDHYTRRYKREVSPASWTSWGSETALNFILQWGANIRPIYLDTIVTRIAKGQNVTVELSMFIIEAFMGNIAGTLLIPSTFGIGLKLTRESDGGIDWWTTAVTSAEANTIENELVGRSEAFIAQNTYRQVELFVWAMSRTAQDSGAVEMDHDGVKMDININDAMETGS